MARNPRLKQKKTQAEPDSENLDLLAKSYEVGNLELAESLTDNLLNLYPNNYFLWMLKGILLRKKEKYRESLAALSRSIELNPSESEPHYNLGNLFQIQGNYQQAVKHYAEAIRINPKFFEAYLNISNSYTTLESYREAESALLIAIGLKPTRAELYISLGILQWQQKKFALAAESYRKAIRLNPLLADAYNNLANVLKEMGRLELAESNYLNAIRLRPNYTEAHNNLGLLYLSQGKIEAATNILKSIVAKDSGSDKTYVNLALVQRSANCLVASEQSCRQAILINPRNFEAFNNLGMTLLEMGKAEESEVYLRKAIELNPNHIESYNNLGSALKAQKKLGESERFYREAIRLNPTFLSAKLNLSLLLLLTSNFEEGLPLYEYRWDGSAEQRRWKRQLQGRSWLGQQSLNGRRILIYAEQGIGDTLQFCRYLQCLAALGAETIFEVQPTLIPLLSKLEGVKHLIGHGEALPDFDYHCPLLSLPLALKTNLSNIPASGPYLFARDKQIEKWRTRLGESGFKIGVCWRGLTNNYERASRSMPLEYFREISNVPGVRLISLHRRNEIPNSEIDEFGATVELLEEDYDQEASFLDAAAVMHCCDLIITVDTAIAHLAGALGMRTWLALKYVPDWRWMLERDDSPWYPSMRLFRQTQRDSWASISSRITQELRSELAQAL